MSFLFTVGDDGSFMKCYKNLFFSQYVIPVVFSEEHEVSFNSCLDPNSVSASDNKLLSCFKPQLTFFYQY